MKPRRGLPVLALVCVAGCMPPGITHGPRVQGGTYVSGTVVRTPMSLEDADITAVLSVRLASESRRAGRLGQQFTLLVPVPLISAAVEESSGPSALLLTTGEFYRETDHPNSARVPRGWGVQASLASIAPYAKIGWYGERGGVHITNGFGAYGGTLGVFPAPKFFVWWPSLTLEVQPHPALTTALHAGGSLVFDVEPTDMQYHFIGGITFTVGGF